MAEYTLVTFGDALLFSKLAINSFGAVREGGEARKMVDHLNKGELTPEEIKKITIIKLPPNIWMQKNPQNGNEGDICFCFSTVNAVTAMPRSDGKHGFYAFAPSEELVLLESG